MKFSVPRTLALCQLHKAQATASKVTMTEDRRWCRTKYEGSQSWRCRTKPEPPLPLLPVIMLHIDFPTRVNHDTMSRLCAITGEFDQIRDEDSDLRQDYQNAVDCLIQCETLFNSFQEQLRLKDDRIITLEDKVMDLSLELAALKARLDLPNLKSSETEASRSSSSTQQKRPSVGSCSCSSNRRISWTSWASFENSSNIQFNVPNFGNLINTSLRWLEAKRVNSNGGVQVEFPKDCENDSKTGYGGGVDPTGGKMLRRHTSNLKRRSSDSLHLERPFRRSRSAASSGITGLTTLEGVVFPVSSFEVFSKGCRMDKSKKTDMRNSEWPDLG